MKTIKIILLLFCIILGINAKAQTVGYTYKALAAEGGKSSVSCPLKPSDSAPLC